MVSSRSHYSLLQSILQDKAFHRLAPLRDPMRRAEMPDEERKLLALLFSMQGETQLQAGDQQALETFALALDIAPEEAEVWYQQGRAWLDYARSTQREQGFMLAHQRLERATSVNPSHFEAWHLKAQSLMEIGLATGESHYHQEAARAFQLAEPHCPKDAALNHRFCWDWARNWYLVGKGSGEAVDFRYAALTFQAAAAQATEPVFWCHYGQTSTELARLLGRSDLLAHAITCYRKALDAAPESFTWWAELSLALELLCESSGDSRHYEESFALFEHYAPQHPETIDFWLGWAQLLLRAAQEFHDVIPAEQALEKLSYLEELSVESHPRHMALSCEAWTFLGLDGERLDHLYQAHAHISAASELSPDSSDIWVAYGNCLIAFGLFFADEDYFEQAIEKFHIGVTLDDQEARLWHGMGASHLRLGEIYRDADMLQQAITCLGRAAELRSTAASCWQDLGCAWMQLGEVTEERQPFVTAVEKLEHALALRGGIDGHPPLDWLYNYGCALDYLGDFGEDATLYRQAADLLSRVVAVQPENLPARYNLALALSHLGEVTDEVDYFLRAVEQLEHVIAHEAEDEAAWNEWGLILLTLSQLLADASQPQLERNLQKQAESKLMQAVSLGSVQAYYNMACLYSLTHNFDLALDFLQRAATYGGLAPREEMLHDEWLLPLRETLEFQSFLQTLPE